MEKRLIVVFATALLLCAMLFVFGCASAQHSGAPASDVPTSDAPADAPTADVPDAGNKTSATPLPPIPAELLKEIETNMVKIPTGIPPAGSRTSSYNKKDPVIKIQSFMLSRYEVTQEQWLSVMGFNPSEDQGPDLPVTNISWDDAQQFILRLNETKGGEVFRLPTAAEWEYACRAGAKGEGPMKKNEATLSKYAWWDKNSGGSVHPVGKLKPNAWGVYDILGNVSEWLQDPYEPETSQGMRFEVGGSYAEPNFGGLICWPSGGAGQGGRDSYTGMRLAKNPEKSEEISAPAPAKKKKK